jgi:hypothetical protein
VPVTYFSETLPGARAVRLTAAVAWRGTPDGAAATGGRGPVGWFRRIRHQLWLRYGPLGADVHVAGRRLFGGAAYAPGAVSQSGVAPGGTAAYFDEGARVLRVLGRVYRAPPAGRALVLLVDAAGRPGAEPRLTVRTVPAPVVDVPPPAGWRPEPGAMMIVMIPGHPAWTAALRADPVVRAFLDGARGRGAG